MAVSGHFNPSEEEKLAFRHLLIESVPKTFWSDYFQKSRAAYLTVFRELHDDRSLLDEMKPALLPHKRHARMETVLHDVARDHGLSVSANLIKANNCRYVFVGAGAVCFVQHYVPEIGALPKPAAFREKLAAMNEVTHAPAFEFLGEPEALMSIKQVYGITTHNPVGKKFTEEHQALQEIRFGVPSPDMKEWIDEPSIAEIIVSYPEAPAKDEEARELEWRTQPEEKKRKE